MTGHQIVFDCEIGRMVAVSSGKALVRIDLDKKACTSDPDALCLQARDEILEYLDGKRSRFAFPIDPQGTPFFKAVCLAAATVPCGQTISYQQLAELAGYPGAARAAGSAMKHNQLMLAVPCHRIIRSDGKLGGFSAGQGPALKKKLLEHEARFCTSSH